MANIKRIDGKKRRRLQGYRHQRPRQLREADTPLYDLDAPDWDGGEACGEGGPESRHTV